MSAAARNRGAVTKKYALVMLSALVLGAVLLFPGFYQSARQASEVRLPGEVLRAPACDLAQAPCVASHAGLSVTLSVDSAKFRSYEPLTFSVKVSGMEAESARIEFEGVEMFMGVNELPLLPASGGGFSGSTSLPGHAYPMTWRARVQLMQADSLVESEFLFDLK
ncbi:hypothetical protein [Marinobacterium rhizophilum]|uniref:YtkA-like domain-containing protein n=1 Tax=Marinobacterium rhizophilum TaxID=420402 RepID=A0ABY5HFW0_9GAMM|nr:hypothetical protein [Marinobacterium rhizophilum]UTW10736.1 hypothetical protein KDW95_15755 [Marinobacterium rhizophilum]